MGFEVKNHLLYQDGEEVSFKKSPNHGEVITPELVVVHYTASDGLMGTIEWLCKPQGKKSVSAHVVVARTGVVWQLVPFNLAAWHAGQSEWDGREWCNHFSIGIENMGWGKDWPEAQVQANIDILIALHRAYPTIKATVGHEDVAPGRKFDPGPNYPWDRVTEALKQVGF
jgi:N-acetyl-anhydromuramyl-L-alanine amidase AmpD